MQKQWEISNDFATENRFKKFAENHPREFDSCGTNLQRLSSHLNSGIQLSVLAQNLSFFRSEGDGLFRIGQTGIRSAKESRLYICPHEPSKTIFILEIGTKETQRADIASSKKTIKQIKHNFSST